MITIARTPTGTEVAIVLPNGTIAGVGRSYGDSHAALYHACVGAIERGYAEAACGHARELSESEESAIRQLAEKAGYRS